ncbi:MAG: TatD family hydrolase [Clostridia bacterium]|nr:TatD family hydrolase [Clostridia bacterium]
MLFDVHAHYDDERFNEDRDILLSSMHTHNVGHIINIGCDIPSSEASIALAEKYPFMYAAVGFHPHEATVIKEGDYDIIKKMAQHEKVVAIGEIGLDYYYGKDTMEIQRKVFREQIELAKEVNLPFQVHNRDSTRDCLMILREAKMGDRCGMMHCFSESKETAREMLNLGMKISIGGVVTFKNNVKTVEVVKYVPIEHIMIETDCPYLAPVPYRGKRNSSVYVQAVAEKIAELKGMDTQEVIEITERNAMEFYGIND